MKRSSKYLTLLASVTLAVGAGAFMLQNHVNTPREVVAATQETNRVWLQVSSFPSWDNDGAHTQIHYWGGASGTAFPGVTVNWDSINKLVYFDLAADVTHYIWVRTDAAGTTAWNQTADLLVADGVDTSRFELSDFGPGAHAAFTPQTTQKVWDLADSIDTSAEACSETAAQTAVDTYNAMPDFEQDQFDVLLVDHTEPTPSTTGLERLNYLRTFYGITTVLNAPMIGNQNNVSNNTRYIASFAVLGIAAAGGFFFISRRKRVIR